MLIKVKFTTAKHKKYAQMSGEITIDSEKTPVMPTDFIDAIHKNMLPDYPRELIQIKKVEAKS